MSIEQLIAANTAALEANTAALLKAGGGSAKGDAKGETTGKSEKTETKSTKTTKTAYEPKHTKAEAQAAANELKEEKGVAAAKAVIKELGFEKLADIEKAEDIDKLYAACKAALGESTASDDDNI